jgi:AcrR family transcriptional regulator
MPAASYHHGNLRESLVEAAIDVARDRGPEGLAVRDLARRVGVSHNAAYRHFADRDALVAEVALRGMAGLVAAMQAGLDEVRATEPVLRARLRLAAIGRGYVDFALGEPGLFRVAFSSYPHLEAKPEAPPGADPFGLLNSTLDELVDVGFLHPEARPGAEIMCWSAVHGFALLHLDGPLGGEADDVRAAALEHVLAAVDRSYAATTGAATGPADLRALDAQVNDR